MKRNKNILFIANTSFISKNISTYQTLCQAESLNKFTKVFLILPNRNDFKKDNSDIYFLAKERLGLNKNVSFKIKCIDFFDISAMKWINHHIRFAITNFMYSIATIKYIFKSDYQIIYTRDFYTMALLSILKTLKILKKYLIFESHQFSNIRKFFLQKFDLLIVINKFQGDLYKHKKSIVLHDGIWESDIKENNSSSLIKKSIFFSGTCTKSKGIERIIALSEYLKDFKFYIASLENINNKNLPAKFYKENINWLGKLDREALKSFINKMEYCILPNDPLNKENLYTSPMKLFEYLSNKKPIIASPIKTIEEILKPTDYIKLPNKLDNFQETANLIRSIDSKTLSTNYIKIVKQYTWEIRARNLFNFIDY